MCTVIKFLDKDGNPYFGRNLDLDDHNYGEKPLLTPVGYEMHYKHLPSEKITTPIIGMGMNYNNYPLYFEAGNEQGLAIASLNFPNNAYFPEEIVEGKNNVTPYELMVYILNHYNSVEEIKEKLAKEVNIIGTPFNEHMPIAPVHWIVSDSSEKSIVIEVTEKRGLEVLDNPVNVLTNNPDFRWHLTNLDYYINLNINDAEKTHWNHRQLHNQGVGTGGVGLPGDSTPQSRFVRAAFLNAQYPETKDEKESVARAFNTLGSVAMPRGTVINNEGNSEFTLYSVCISPKTNSFYYRRWNDAQIKEVKITDENREGSEIVAFD